MSTGIRSSSGIAASAPNFKNEIMRRKKNFFLPRQDVALFFFLEPGVFGVH
jgi:hypothetical protein